MKIITTIAQMQAHSSRLRDEGDRIGFVPTMGYLHEGHLSLMRQARQDNHALVVSIFINPIQFGPDEDYDSYPRDLEEDTVMLREVGCDILFTPSAEEMYPDGNVTTVTVAGLTDSLCGASRPGHFDGVTTVVNKLFNITKPHRAYFGLKDYQQYRVLDRMVTDLDMDIDIIGLPTVREKDGLAMSSRNAYLSADQRESALTLSRSLEAARKMVSEGERDPGVIESRIQEIIESQPLLSIDYVSIVDEGDLSPIDILDRPALLALAVRVGEARLIDNTVLLENG
jgi:pantoate--beta-alanine ligase